MVKRKSWAIEHRVPIIAADVHMTAEDSSISKVGSPRMACRDCKRYITSYKAKWSEETAMQA
eukprot:1543658-Amphidinium_carterae.1